MKESWAGGGAASDPPGPAPPREIARFNATAVTARSLASKILLGVGLVIVGAQGLTGHVILAIFTGVVLVTVAAFAHPEPTGRGRLTDQALELLDYEPPLSIPWEWIVGIEEQPVLDHLPQWQRAIATEPLRLELLDGQVVAIDLTDAAVIREIKNRAWAF
ncbi:MAG: hypothetical protein GY745_08390 [Actinomycetia bacterium]|nr:hypothetical protein [Actinomycetes bacterium]MCP4085053.1 hypothetical protein [Actinomycetes bacterium]